MVQSTSPANQARARPSLSACRLRFDGGISMRRAEAVLIIAIAVSLGGCVLRKPQAAKPAPPAPKPVAPAPPAPPPQPLSIPQTNVYLPAPQPVSPEALATTIPPTEPPPAPPAPPKPVTRTAPSRQPVRVEPAPPPPTPPVEGERPTISELTTEPEKKRLQDEANARRQEVEQLVARIPKNGSRQQRDSMARIKTFQKQSQEAEDRGDMRQ